MLCNRFIALQNLLILTETLYPMINISPFSVTQFSCPQLLATIILLSVGNIIERFFTISISPCHFLASKTPQWLPFTPKESQSPYKAPMWSGSWLPLGPHLLPYWISCCSNFKVVTLAVPSAQNSPPPGIWLASLLQLGCCSNLTPSKRSFLITVTNWASLFLPWLPFLNGIYLFLYIYTYIFLYFIYLYITYPSIDTRHLYIVSYLTHTHEGASLLLYLLL